MFQRSQPITSGPGAPNTEDVLGKLRNTSIENFQNSSQVKSDCTEERVSSKALEDLVLPAAIALAEIVMDKEAADTLKTVPLSNSTVSHWVDDMSINIVTSGG